MSEEREEFLKYAAEAKEKAARYDNEMRALLLSVADAYELLARVQSVVDNGAVQCGPHCWQGKTLPS